jgi:hypothetical protein
MQKFNKTLLWGAGLIVLGLIGSIMDRGSNPAALRGADRDPTVIIEGPLPLPVTGSVSISGMPNMNINGTPSVNVANSPTVHVGNSSSSPVLTRAVDNPALEPFQFTQTGANVFFSFGVPTGKTLVIENVSIACIEPPAPAGYFTDFRLFTTVNGTFAQHSFAPAQISTSGFYDLITDQVTHIYASGGTSVTIGDGAGTPSGSNCDATISGHLVNSL